jgi:hypothetical protein
MPPEPTDAAGVRDVSAKLTELLVGRTVVMVSYSPGTVELTLDDGKTVEFEAWWDWNKSDGGLEIYGI